MSSNMVSESVKRITGFFKSLQSLGEIVLEMSQRRVLWARIKGELREVQVCRCVTQVQGSLQPLFRHAHSLITARRCGRRRSWQLRSTSSTPSHIGPDLKSERYTYAQRRVCLILPDLQFLCQYDSAE